LKDVNMLTPRQRVITAMKRELPDQVPKFADFSPGIYERFLVESGFGLPEKTIQEAKGRPLVTYQSALGLPDPADYFEYDVRVVEFGQTERNTDFHSFYEPIQLPDGRSRIDEWGIGYVRGSEHHFEEIVHPMASFTCIDELEEYPWPDVTASYRREIARTLVEGVHQKDLAVMAWPPMKGGTIFETAWGLRGFEQLIIDMMTAKDFAACLLDKITALSISNACYFAACGVDVLLTGDDFGMQDRMMISPKLWREWFKPRYADLISSVKAVNPDVLIFYHSDGMIEPIIPELIEIGVEILNPVQPECMDPVEIKRQFGDQLAFWGTVGTQSTMPFGNVDEVKAVVKERIQTIGQGGGLLLAPTHKLEPDVPWENILAFFDAVNEYGVYD
jgi:uroporphyrinogen decarboxylase